jgi:alkanesulfonate monooxygenase SsuD/methylene tetrahydromethanopterin reductase-like flavin-dependent oxidoreductase (luciferase family)
MTVSTDASVSLAAELGLNACYWQPPPRKLRERFSVYTSIRATREGRTYRLGEAQAVMRHTYVASSMEEARRIAEEGVMFSFSYNNPFRGMQVFMNPDEELRPDMTLDWNFLVQRHLLVGSPQDVADKIHELEDVCGLEYLILNYGHGWLAHGDAVRNLELFASKVMPFFKSVAPTPIAS